MFLVGLIILYVRTLISERAKNKMLKKYQAELEQTKFEHLKELEKLKSEHDLDIAKRKHQYESKHNVYVKFFNYLDESAFKTKEYFDKSTAINEKFLKNFLNATSMKNEKMKTNVITVFQKELMNFIMETQQGFINLKQTSNTIELIAGVNVQEALNDYILANEQVIELSNKVLKELPKFIMSGNQSKIQAFQEPLNQFGEYVKIRMSLLKDAMRSDLEYD